MRSNCTNIQRSKFPPSPRPLLKSECHETAALNGKNVPGKTRIHVGLCLSNYKTHTTRNSPSSTTSRIRPHWCALDPVPICLQPFFLPIFTFLSTNLSTVHVSLKYTCIYNRCLLLLLTFLPLLFSLLPPFAQSSSSSKSSSSPPIIRPDLPPLLDGGRFRLIFAE